MQFIAKTARTARTANKNKNYKNHQNNINKYSNSLLFLISLGLLILVVAISLFNNRSNILLNHFLHSSQTMSDNNCSSANNSTSSSNSLIKSTIIPVKSSGDTRDYRIIELSNGLSCILVHDLDTDKSGCGLDVNVGHWLDPLDKPGLAHFLEHMLFLGTEKYPDENSYNSFLNSHGGSSNAYTSATSTNYYFDVRHEYLTEMLDRFAQFFISPLFTATATEREMNAVNNENSKNLLSDVWRIGQLIKSTSNSAHPYSHFGTGNLATLQGPTTRQQLIQFHSQYYSSSIMKLCVLGRESLDELQDLVLQHFSGIKNLNITAPSFPTNAFSAENSEESQVELDAAQSRQYYEIIPIKDIRTLSLLFPMPAVTDYYREKPLSVLSHLIGHEAEGSILSTLKQLGWANALSAGLYESFHSFSLFSITIELTEVGLQQVPAIIELIYAYLAILRSTAESEWRRIYQEEADIHRMNFAFKSKESPFHYVSHLASVLQDYAPKDVLQGSYLFENFDFALIQRYLALLKPQNCRVQVVAQAFAPETGQAAESKENKRTGGAFLQEKW
jgi:insulysin